MEQDPIPQQFNSLPDNSSEAPMGAFEAGDIVLPASGSPKKGRKGLVFLILIFVLVLGGGGYLAWQNFWKNSEKEQTVSQLEIQEAFNKYINYLFYGEKELDNKIDFEAFMESYNLYDPTIFAETATFDELKEANAFYEDFRDKYKNSTLDEAQVYFYYYLGCQDDSIDSNECVVILGEQYNSDKDESKEFMEKIDLRAKAMQAVMDTYYDIYDIDTTVKSEAI